MNILIDRTSWVRGDFSSSRSPYDTSDGYFGNQGDGYWFAYSKLTESGDYIEVNVLKAEDTGRSAPPWVLVVVSPTPPGKGSLVDMQVIWSEQGREVTIPRTELPVGLYVYLQVTDGDPVNYYMSSYHSIGPGTFDIPVLEANDDEATTLSGVPVVIPVLDNDTYGGGPITLGDLKGPPEILTNPEIGIAVVNPDGTITYSPPEGFVGEVEFEYMIAPFTCPELVIQDTWIHKEDLIKAIPEIQGDFYFNYNGQEYPFMLYSDGYYGPAADFGLYCNPHDYGVDFYPWEVTIHWQGGSQCVLLTNECSPVIPTITA